MCIKNWHIFCVLVLMLTACAAALPGQPAQMVNMANPASVFCEQNGGKIEIRTARDGGQLGMCVFPDKSECDEWAFFRGECKPGDSLKKPAAATPTAPELWLKYRNAALGYSFDYPPDAKIESASDATQTLTITGPLIGGEHWPVIYFNHPKRADYAPSVDADLAQWLKNNNLLLGERQADVQIAGQTAVHLRQKAGPQSFSTDHYFFTRAGQLYGVVILHAGGKEDWQIYNRFLESIRFEK